MAGFFVTATGTDIGKTYVTAGLVRHLRNRGEAVSALKPVVSGFSRETVATSDPAVLLEALGEAVTDKSIAAISPWRFAAPLSPDMAAAREGRAVEFDALVDFCRTHLESETGTEFIEGVGGVLVPLDARHTVRDWMAALDLPVIVVAGSYLGTISHTLTALEAIARSGLKTAALVINESADSTVPLAETIATLTRFMPGIPIVALPRGAGPKSDAAFVELRRVLHSK
jgi:dethiobiotin synthetase